MNDIMALNGYILYNSFLSGYENLLRHKKQINDINVFPVPDGDTGNNMVSTFYSTIQVSPVTRSVSTTMNNIADRALSGARGNSGIIVAQFLNGLANECGEKETMTTVEFGSALRNAAAFTYLAIENPKEGTLITILRIWAEEMYRLGQIIHDFRELFTRSLNSARLALEKTKEQLEVLKKANVVDAGASGFVSFLEGVARMIATGVVPPKRSGFLVAHSEEEDENHDIMQIADTITFRYCTEALLVYRNTNQASQMEELSAKLKQHGDSLIISKGRDKIKIHIHTNHPSSLFYTLRDYGHIIEQKVDDMRLQYNAVHHPVSKIAIVTDSIADIPQEMLDRFQIHVIPQKILWGDDEYLDRLTITPETFYPYLDKKTDYPSSSIPDPYRVDQVFAWLASHYESIIAVPVGKVLSGTWQIMENSAQKLKKNGYPITVVDSRLNSAAQGLSILSAAENAAAGYSYSDILDALEKTIHEAKIYVSVSTFKYMVRGGRVSAIKGFIAAITNLKPVISLDEKGKGIAFGASFSQNGCKKKILKEVIKNKKSIHRYAIVHANAPEKAQQYAEDLNRILGKKTEYLMQISPIVGIHAGIGAVAVAWI